MAPRDRLRHVSHRHLSTISALGDSSIPVTRVTGMINEFAIGRLHHIRNDPNPAHAPQFFSHAAMRWGTFSSTTRWKWLRFGTIWTSAVLASLKISG